MGGSLSRKGLGGLPPGSGKPVTASLFTPSAVHRLPYVRPVAPANAGIVLAIDPGYTHTALVTYDPAAPLSRRLLRFERVENKVALAEVRDRGATTRGERRKGIDPQPWDRPSHLAVEMIASYGMAVGREVFETCVWIGRFVEAWGGPHTPVYRKAVKIHLCGSTKAKDPNVRQALIDKFGPGKDRAIGRKATPGPLYGVSADVWAALAVAVTWAEGGAK
jgi:hypothetical protein